MSLRLVIMAGVEGVEPSRAVPETGVLPLDDTPVPKTMHLGYAFSDAVGHSMADRLKEYANSLYTDAEFEQRRLKYEHATPFTKESLLYRELFEKYYPGQGEMVVDFWMPNKTWKGCDVNDPSARVLSNYGASGV